MPLEPLVANIFSALNNCPLDDSFVEAWNAAKFYVDKIKSIQLFEMFIKTGEKEVNYGVIGIYFWMTLCLLLLI